MTGKIVNFSKCRECVNWEKSENEDPCWDCLSIPYRENSKNPVHFVRKENAQNDVYMKGDLK